MRYEIGKMFECEIEQSKPLRPIDYIFPTERENQKYINLLNTQVITDFEVSVVVRRYRIKQIQNEKNKIHNQG